MGRFAEAMFFTLALALWFGSCSDLVEERKTFISFVRELTCN